jgi:formylglycine-generating enzyme required for sulfatase activity
MSRTKHTAAKIGCCTPEPRRRQPQQAQNITRADQPPDHNFITLSPATFAMGATDGPYLQDGEGPVRQVTLDGYCLAPLTVTNAHFATFVADTGYVTLAEREGASFVFHMLAPDTDGTRTVATQASWWRQIKGAYWRWPEGPNAPDIFDRLDHPAVHISLTDALAYCHWAGTRLPTEAEWENAARGGLEHQPFPWGDMLEPDSAHHSNVWQGDFPASNTADDGYVGTAPAQCFAPNQYGFYAMTGNVWEWTADRFTHLHSPRPVTNPTGPLNGASFVAKGGSYLCHASYCTRYRTSSRQALDPRTTAGNLGFRVAKDLN